MAIDRQRRRQARLAARRARYSTSETQLNTQSRGSFWGLLLLGSIFCGALYLAFGHVSIANKHTVVANRMPVETGQLAAPQTSTAQGRYAKCAAARMNCVVDGDTVWLNGQKMRLAEIDTPEIGSPKCAEELRLGLAATQSLIDWMNAGSFEIIGQTRPSHDKFGRRLVTLSRGETSAGQILINQGLAHVWDGRKHSWCDG